MACWDTTGYTAQCAMSHASHPSRPSAARSSPPSPTSERPKSQDADQLVRRGKQATVAVRGEEREIELADVRGGTLGGDARDGVVVDHAVECVDLLDGRRYAVVRRDGLRRRRSRAERRDEEGVGPR